MKTVGEAKSDLWQIMEFSKRFTIEEVWGEELVAKMLTIAVAKPATYFTKNSNVDAFPLSEAQELNDDAQAQGFYVQRSIRRIRSLWSRPRSRFSTIRSLPSSS
ncbi:hypothetical protein O9993_21165 [Vibrio lentus]|nr:hypothetical protein [Vibrio lentus]